MSQSICSLFYLYFCTTIRNIMISPRERLPWIYRVQGTRNAEKIKIILSRSFGLSWKFWKKKLQQNKFLHVIFIVYIWFSGQFLWYEFFIFTYKLHNRSCGLSILEFSVVPLIWILLCGRNVKITSVDLIFSSYILTHFFIFIF